ncbi:hypothetical protein, partial [Haloplanus salinarum]
MSLLFINNSFPASLIRGRTERRAICIEKIDLNFRSEVDIDEIVPYIRPDIETRGGAENASTSVECDALMFDNESTSDTMPYMEIQ